MKLNEEQLKWVIDEKEDLSKISVDVQNIYGTGPSKGDQFSMKLVMLLG